MNIQIMEIGTSDFGTMAGKKNGIFIEPVKYYYDKLPNSCIKENVAISNYEGEVDLYYITTEDIERLKVPKYLKGCGSIKTPHKLMLKHVPLSQIRCDRVKVVKIKSIIEKYNITHINFLKIDAEGHDYIILNSFLDDSDIKPDKIKFENNNLANRENIEKLCDRLEIIGYVLKYTKNDIIAIYPTRYKQIK